MKVSEPKSLDVFLIAALSADGFLAQESQQSSLTWRSREDGRFFTQVTKQARALVMGATTFATMRRPLPERKHFVLTRAPEQFAHYDPVEVEALTATPAEVVARAERAGFTQLAVCGGSSVYRQFVETGLVNRAYLTVEPIWFGQGVSLFDRPLLQRLELLNVIELSVKTKVFEYKILSQAEVKLMEK